MEKRESAEQCMNNLMNAIERSLSLKNRDKFTQNIATFRRDINECLRSNSNSTNNNNLVVIQQQQQIQPLNNQQNLISSTSG